MQRKNKDDLGFLLNSWDDNMMWDALSLQEVTNESYSDEDKKDEVTIIKDVGRGRRTVVIAPQKPGHMRVAVAVHHRWAKPIRSTTASSLGRSLRVDLLMRNGSTIRIITSHIPSSINCTGDEIELHLGDLGLLVGGLRRHMTMLGMDANIHIGEECSTPFVSGSALGSASRSQVPLATSVINELQGYSMRLHNTFEDWWRRQSTSSTATAAAAPSSRSTWKGHLFGTLVQRPVDYIAADIVTSRRLVSTHFAPPTGYPSDHVALGCEYDLNVDLGLKRKRPPAKPIGWWPQHIEQYDSIMSDDLEKNRPQTIKEITNVIATVAPRVARVRRRRRQPGRSETEDSFRAALRAGSTTPDQRRCLIESMWAQRHRIAAEKTSTAAAAILRDLRGGGWGSRHLTRACAQMPYLQEQGSKIVDSSTIELKTHAYYTELFSHPPPEFKDADDALSAELTPDRTMELTTECCFIVDAVARARWSLRRNKTCGDDGVVPEMLAATSAADWRWAVIFNRRIMNMQDDPAVADDSWDSFRIRLLAKISAPSLFELLRPIAVFKASAKLWSRCFFGALQQYDTVPNNAHMGFKKSYACAELVLVVRLLLSKTAEWELETHLAQVDFARAYDSIWHTAILVAMRRGGVPEPLAMAYIREARRACMQFEHADWSTQPVRAGIGLRASYRETVRALFWRPGDPKRRRLGTSVMGAPPSRWEDPIQQVCNVNTPAWTCWREVAQDKETWAALETAFVHNFVNIVRPASVPRGIWMIGETPEST